MPARIITRPGSIRARCPAAARELALLLGAFALYPLVALIIGDDPAAPLAQARAIADLERALGLFVEPDAYAWISERPALLAAASVAYVWAHVPVMGWALVWTYLVRPDRFVALRTLFLWAQGFTVALYVLVPTAPPRLLGTDGFRDTLAGFWGRELAESAHLLQSPFAAMPSGHVVFALIAGGTFARLGDRTWLRAFGWLYPPVIAVVTILTANHFWLDALVAAGVVALAAALTRRGEARSLRRPPPQGLGRGRPAAQRNERLGDVVDGGLRPAEV